MKIELTDVTIKKYVWLIPMGIAYFPIRYLWDNGGEVGKMFMALIGAVASLIIGTAIKENTK